MVGCADEEEAAEESGLLSEQEKAFLEHYFLALGRHYRTMVLSQLPDDYQSLVRCPAWLPRGC